MSEKKFSISLSIYQLSACGVSTCQNGGKCVPDGTSLGFSCDCVPGTSGVVCEVNLTLMLIILIFTIHHNHK